MASGKPLPLLLALAATLLLAGCAGTKATTVYRLGPDDWMEANAIRAPFAPDADALAWTDAHTLAQADPQAVLEALTRDGRDPAYRDELAKAVGARRTVDWDWLLERAVAYDHRAVGRLAVSGGADPNRRIRLEWHPIEEEDGALANALAEVGLDALGRAATPLYLAGAGGNARAQWFLLEVGADPNQGASPPILAPITQGDLPLVQRYVACGADLTAVPMAGNAASPEIADWLVAHGARLRPTATTFSPLQTAILQGNRPVARLLLRHEPPNNPLPGDDTFPRATTLTLAAAKLPELVPDLLDAGANPFANANQAFLTAKTLLILGETDRFRALGFPPDLTLPPTQSADAAHATDAAPMPLLGALLEQALIDLRHDPEASQRAIAAANHLLDLGADPNRPVFDGSLTYRDGVWKADNTPLRDLFAKRLPFAREQFPTPTPAQADALFACQVLARRMADATQWCPGK